MRAQNVTTSQFLFRVPQNKPTPTTDRELLSKVDLGREKSTGLNWIKEFYEELPWGGVRGKIEPKWMEHGTPRNVCIKSATATAKKVP